MPITANPQHLSEWSAGKIRCRWDYDCPDHVLAEMIEAGEQYFSLATHMLRAGDIIYVTDAANGRATLIVNWVDQTKRIASWDVDATYSERPAKPAEQRYAIRWKGPRGGKFAIVDADNKIITRDLATRDEAERELAVLMRSKAA